MAAIVSITSRRPRVMIQSPNSPRQKSCQRCAIPAARYVSLVFVIFSVAPTDTCFQESVDISVQYRGRVADLVVSAQVLHHLVRVQNVRAHLIAPGASAVTFQGVQLSAFF